MRDTALKKHGELYKRLMQHVSDTNLSIFDYDMPLHVVPNGYGCENGMAISGSV